MGRRKKKFTGKIIESVMDVTAVGMSSRAVASSGTTGATRTLLRAGVTLQSAAVLKKHAKGLELRRKRKRRKKRKKRKKRKRKRRK